MSKKLVLFISLALLTSVSIFYCTDKPTESNNVNTSDYNVYLTGKVFDKNGRPLANTIVNLINYNLSDTTDSEGIYLLIDSTDVALYNTPADSTDTLNVIKEGQLITSMEIAQFIDTLPDLFVIQRDIYGNIQKTMTSFSKIEAVITGDDIPDSLPKLAELWFNVATNGFSRFVYSVYTATVKDYAVYVNVYDDSSRFTGRSVTVPFNTNAGNIGIPLLDPRNAIPTVFAGNDSILSINDSLLLNPTAIDSFGGTIVLWEWNIGDSSAFTPVTNGDTTIIIPAIANPDYPCIVRIFDDDGNWDVDTLVLNVLQDAPVCSASTSTPTVSINDTIRLQGTASDTYGNIVKWEWDVGNSGTFVNTTPVSNFNGIASSTPKAAWPCILKVTDDDGNVGMDTVTVNIILDNPRPTASTTTPELSINDTIKLQGTAIDDFGKIIKWEWGVGNSGTFVDVSPDSGYVAVAPSSGGHYYPCVLRVTDDDGNVVSDTIKINVLYDAPIPIASVDSTTDTVSINDTIKLLGTATDGYGEIVKWEWDIGNTGTFVDVSPDSGNIGVACSTANPSYPCVLKVTDDDGNVGLDTIGVNVLLDAPICSASTTTPTVSINDTIKLQGTAADGYGKIVKWEWDIGNTGTFVDVSPDSGHISIACSTANSSYPCVLKVTDDDENVGLDTITINVLYDAPVCSASTTNPTVCVNDTIKLQGTATDDYGRIVKWEWDVGNTGVFVETTPDSSFTTIAPSSQQIKYQCVLKVMDDDDLQRKDTVTIFVCASYLSDIEGNLYHTLKFGNQEWTIENLRTTKLNDGAVIPNITSSIEWYNCSTSAYCYYNNNEKFKDKYGAIYNMYAVNTGKLAPEGWHVPTDADWDTLQNYLIANGYNWDGTTSGNKIGKSLASKTGWKFSNITGTIGNDPSLNNSTGFSALPGGARNSKHMGGFYYLGEFAMFWSTTTTGAAMKHIRRLNVTFDNLESHGQNAPKWYGYSVRLVRD